jgi:hypothetical protein
MNTTRERETSVGKCPPQFIALVACLLLCSTAFEKGLALDFSVDLCGRGDSINSVQKSFHVEIKEDKAAGRDAGKPWSVSIGFLPGSPVTDTLKVQAFVMDQAGKKVAAFALGSANVSTPFSTSFFYDAKSAVRIVFEVNCTANGMDEAVYRFDPWEEKELSGKAGP